MDFQSEISRAKKQYEGYEQQKLNRTIWAPFNESEVNFRSQQLIAFAALLRQIGRSDLSGWRILDYGCGEGRILRSYLDMGADAKNLYGVDLNENRLADGRRISPQIAFQSCDGVHLDFQHGSFDLVTQYVVFSSIASPELRQVVADEMWRVLKPGGYIFWWDLIKMASAASEYGKALNYETLFPNVPSRELHIRPTPKPSETLRSFPGAWVIGVLADVLAKRQTHIAALIGPKKQ